MLLGNLDDLGDLRAGWPAHVSHLSVPGGVASLRHTFNPRSSASPMTDITVIADQDHTPESLSTTCMPTALQLLFDFSRRVDWVILDAGWRIWA